MGSTYTVPRSAKGESRIFYIFSVKSLATTAVLAVLGWFITKLIGLIIPMSIWPTLIVVVLFGAVGFAIGAAKIPDNPIMGPLQKAGGEQILDILMRVFTFRGKKKMYLYGINRKPELDEKTGNYNSNAKNKDMITNMIKLVKK